MTSTRTAPSSSRSAAGTGSRSRSARRGGTRASHRGRERGRRRRLVRTARGATSTSWRPATCAAASSRSRDDDACGPTRSSTASTSGELDGHALGNLMLVGLTETTRRLLRRARRGRSPARRGRPGAARRRRSRSCSRPSVEGGRSRARSRCRTAPDDPPGRAGARRRPAPADAIAAIAPPTRSCSRPGSLYTSLLPVLCVRGAARAPWRGAGAGSCRSPTCARSCPRPRASTPPTTCGRAGARRPGRRVRLPARRRARRRRRP